MEGIRIQLVLTVLLLNLTCFIGVFFVSAFLVDTRQAENVFSIGNNRTEIVQVSREAKAMRSQAAISKDVSIKNTGKNDCRVRVMVLFSDCDARDYTTIDYNLDCWKMGDDGYYYYSSVLPAGETTESLFTEIKVSDEADAEKIKGFEIYVYAESINVEAGDFSGCSYSNSGDILCIGNVSGGLCSPGVSRADITSGISGS